MTSIPRKGSPTGSVSTISPDLMAPSMERRLTKHLEKSYKPNKDRLVRSS
jgi:hypothetical protein